MSAKDNGFDIAIVGAGVVGLATAYQLNRMLPEKKIVVLEKEAKPGLHQSSHNSGVIHSGIYYKPGSLKAQNCLRGYKLLLDFFKEHDLKYEICGKIIVATKNDEISNLKMLYQRALQHGLSAVKWLDGLKQIQEYEPFAHGVAAIHVPYAGIADYPSYIQRLAEILLKNEQSVLTNFNFQGCDYKSSQWILRSSAGVEITAKYIIDAAGLYSDRVGRMISPEVSERIIPFRGEYYLLTDAAQNKVRNLIYPVPNLQFPFLGVHFTRMISGGVEAGPNAVLAFHREGYSWSKISLRDCLDCFSFRGFWKMAMRHYAYGFSEMYRSLSKKAFLHALQQLIPDIKDEDIIPGEAGVRAQALSKSGDLLDDFCLRPVPSGLLVINAPSPAATSSLSIGLSIAEHVKKDLG